MKSLVRVGVVLIVGLLMLSYAEVCKAQCAWVLWKKFDYQFGKDAERVNWTLIAAFPEYKQCMKNQIDEFERMRIFWNDVTEKSPNKEKDKENVEAHTGGGGPSQIIVKTKDGISIFEFYCLPDTVDPRK